MLRTLGTLLGYLLAPAGPHSSVSETACGTYDLYAGPGSPRRTLLLVHGVSFKGGRDPRLVAFSRRLALSGLRVAAIDLPGLKRCEFLESDVAAIADLADSLAARFGSGIGLIGFSFGGGLALTAACRTQAVVQVLGFGAFHSLETVWDHVFDWCGREPAREDEWSDFSYMWLVMAYAARESLGIDGAGLCETLLGYCTERSLARKREAYEAIRHLPVVPAFQAILAADRLRAVSPAGRLAAIAAPVDLLHDAGDRIVPATEAERLLAELRQEGKATRALVTPLLDHVDLGSLRGLRDVPELLSIFATALR